MSEGKSAKAYRTISEVAESLGVPQHVLRFWETKFPAVKPLKRGGNRRYYRPEDIELLQVIHRLLHVEGYTIKGAQKLLKEQGARPLVEALLGNDGPVPLALAAAAAEADDEDEAAEETAAREPVADEPVAAGAPAQTQEAEAAPAAAAAGETPAVDAATLAAELTEAAAPAAPAATPATAASGDIAAAVSVMPVEVEIEQEPAIAQTAPEQAPERVTTSAGADPAARQLRGALMEEGLIAELRAIRAQLAEALAAATPAAR